MPDVFRGFYSLPDLQRGEALSSWVCRAAASQLMTCAEFCKFLGVPPHPDLDKGMLDWLWRVSPHLDEQRWGGMLLAGRVLDAMLGMERWHEKLLLTSRRGTALYGFCPRCFAEQPIQHLATEWRFRLWRVCPRHHCSIVLHCHVCYARVETPFNFSLNNMRSVEIPSFGYCLQCGCHLKSAHSDSLSYARQDIFTGISDARRFPYSDVTAALYHGIGADIPGAVGSRAHQIRSVANCGKLLVDQRAMADRHREKVAGGGAPDCGH